MPKNLKEAKNQLVKDSILAAAEEIIEESGLQEISIRKLAKKIGYSPASIYQYYDSKAQIIQEVVQKGYQKINKAIKTEKNDFKNVETEIRYRFQNYIKTALKNKSYYQAVMLSQDENILAQTAILNPKFAKNSAALEFLESLIERGQKTEEFSPGDVKTTAHMIWTATFGLIIRMIIENISVPEKQDNLIENHFNLIFAGIKKGSE